LLLLHCAPHPSLPPFPTRRSSDLGPTVRTIGLIPSLTCIVASRVGQRVGHPVAPPAADASAAGPPPGDLQLLPQSSTPTFPRQVDRKSTRLNSSHDQISYAVFCLK